jgi:hypothetical protein
MGGITGARVYDFGTLSSGQGRFMVEEDVRICVRAWAVDNVTAVPELYIRRGSGAPFEEQTPDTADWKTTNSSSGCSVTSRMVRHTFPKAPAVVGSDTDTIVVTTGDTRSGVQVRIPIRVVKFAPDFRQIGEEIKNK